MNSPITGKPMQLKREHTSLPFRKESYEVTYHFYECDETGERFTTDELDELNTIQVYNQYRERFGIPFPEQIREIREQYGASASKVSEILGLGTNTYRLYETGEMPSVANGRLILSVREPGEFIRQVKASSHLITEKESQKFIATAERLFEEQEATAWDSLFMMNIFGDPTPSEFNGYRTPNLAKVSSVIAYYQDREPNLVKTKLNKLLFYTDFNCFQATGYSMTGITYKAIQYGPVPSQFQKLFVKLCDDGKIEIQETKFDQQVFGEKIISTDAYDEFVFSETEIKVLEFVAEKMVGLKTSKLVDTSHQESGWQQNHTQRALISYPKFAFDLQKDSSFFARFLNKDAV